MTPRLKDPNSLSGMQKRTLKAIRDFIKSHEMPPTVREIGEIFSVKSSTVFAHLKALEKKGFISRSPGKSRGIQLTRTDSVPSGIPFLGQVPAGPFDLAVEQHDEYIDIDARMFGKGDLFALKIKGESMIEAGILNGDTVIVSRCSDANEGEIIVALVEDEATVKKIRRSAGAVLLEPANSTMKPMFFAPGDPEPQIIGRVVGVLRKL